MASSELCCDDWDGYTRAAMVAAPGPPRGDPWQPWPYSGSGHNIWLMGAVGRTTGLMTS